MDDLDVEGRIILKLGLQERTRDKVDWIQLARDRDHKSVPVNTSSIKGGEFLDSVTITFLRSQLHGVS
jgi:hypothetical protein